MTGNSGQQYRRDPRPGFPKGRPALWRAAAARSILIELVATIIDGCGSFVEGIRRVFELIDGSMSMLILTKDGVIAARDKLGRTPLVLSGKKTRCARQLRIVCIFKPGLQPAFRARPGEIVRFTPDGGTARPRGRDAHLSLAMICITNNKFQNKK